VRYVICTFVAMTLFAFGWVVMGYGVFQMLQIGTCASGGPYVPARPCPEGSEALFWALSAGLPLMFVAAGVYLARGNPPGGAPPPGNAGIVIWFWTGLFWALAVGCFLSIWGPEAQPGPGGETAAWIVGVMGLVLGAGGLLSLGLGRVRKRAPSLAVSAVSRLSDAANRYAQPTEHPGGRIDTLDRLRRQGTLTDAEFETLKSQIVAGEE
jgi:hypothetical protein